MKEKEPKNETKEEKFKRIASARTNKILHFMKMLGQCSNKYVYAWNKKELDKIYSALDEGIIELKKKFVETD